MNTREFNKMNMFTAVNSVFQVSKDSTANIKTLSDAIGRFGEKLTVITGRNAQYTTAASGATASKNNMAGALIDAVLRVSNSLLVLGNNKGIEQLKAECRLSPHGLSNSRALELVRICSRVSELAKRHAAELGDYGTVESDLGTLDAAIESFRKTCNEQQRRLSEAKSVRGMLYEDIAEAAGILKNEIDPLMELVKAGNIELYNQYRAARVIKDLGGRYASSNAKTEADAPTITAGPPVAAMKLAA